MSPNGPDWWPDAGSRLVRIGTAGSGLLVAPGLILTVAHVVAGMNRFVRRGLQTVDGVAHGDLGPDNLLVLAKPDHDRLIDIAVIDVKDLPRPASSVDPILFDQVAAAYSDIFCNQPCIVACMSGRPVLVDGVDAPVAERFGGENIPADFPGWSAAGWRVDGMNRTSTVLRLLGTMSHQLSWMITEAVQRAEQMRFGGLRLLLTVLSWLMAIFLVRSTYLCAKGHRPSPPKVKRTPRVPRGPNVSCWLPVLVS